MVFGEQSIANTPENWHSLCAADSLKVIIHDIPHKVNILGDLDLSDHWWRPLCIVMDIRKVAVVLNYPQGIIFDVR